MSARVEKADVLAALTAERVLEHFGIDYRRSGYELRLQVCPTCGPRTRKDAVSVNSDSGQWKCHAHGCSGDILDIVAGMAGLDIERDFRAVLEVAAELAGIPLREVPTERRRYLAELETRRREQQAKLAAERAAAQARAQVNAARLWARLAATSEPGMAYLRRRGVSGVAGDVRFGQRSICLPLRDAAGQLTNVVGRLFVEDPDAPKIRGLAGCTTAGTFGDTRKATSTTGPIVIVEGLVDWLSARVRWPDRLILGAHGAGRLPYVAELAAPLAIGRGALLVPHNDDAGLRYADRAIVALAKGGLPMEDMEVYVIDARHNDLNDELTAGGGA